MKAPAIAGSGLSFSYGARAVLDRVDVSIGAGELVGLIGPNGAGKTTLLHVLLGLLTPASGVVRLGGDDLSKLGRVEIALRAALVPQESGLAFAFTVREVVAMGRTPHLGRFRPEGNADLAAVDAALRATETLHLADRLVSEVSGGERQRVHVARALAQETGVLLLDEPTANLDVEHQLQILELLRALAQQGKAVLVALHDLSLAARFCDRLVLLAGATVVADGPPHEVVTEANLSRYFRIAARVEHGPDGRVAAVIPLSPLSP